jgi:hypothetical protein
MEIGEGRELMSDKVQTALTVIGPIFEERELGTPQEYL